MRRGLGLELGGSGLPVALLLVACSGAQFTGMDDEPGADASADASPANTGGSSQLDAGSGGASADGSAGGEAGTGTGGMTSGGAPGSGGSPGSGGAVSTGGSIGSGGTTSGSGGAGDGGTGTGGAGAAGGAGSGGANSCGDADVIRCDGANPFFPSFDKGCTNDGSCELVFHMTDCCGGGLYMGINHSALACFEAAEGVCESQFPACGCASQGVNVEDGTFIRWDQVDQIKVECNGGRCRSYWPEGTFECGDGVRCTEDQICVTTNGGPAGSEPSYTCSNRVNGCSDCDCLEMAEGCDCAMRDGNPFVTCNLP